ncbi:hypothetical protein JB92DRAFT_2993778 [Gautieria morchelliformis]|nr:hypothetical protein JB92DRAFT_2993778 [Gautieria morchelliformis]
MLCTIATKSQGRSRFAVWLRSKPYHCAPPPPTKRSVMPIPFANLTVNVSARTLGIVLFLGGLKHTIVHCG